MASLTQTSTGPSWSSVIDADRSTASKSATSFGTIRGPPAVRLDLPSRSFEAGSPSRHERNVKAPLGERNGRRSPHPG